MSNPQVENAVQVTSKERDKIEETRSAPHSSDQGGRGTWSWKARAKVEPHQVFKKGKAPSDDSKMKIILEHQFKIEKDGKLEEKMQGMSISSKLSAHSPEFSGPPLSPPTSPNVERLSSGSGFQDPSRSHVIMAPPSHIQPTLPSHQHRSQSRFWKSRKNPQTAPLHYARSQYLEEQRSMSPLSIASASSSSSGSYYYGSRGISSFDSLVYDLCPQEKAKHVSLDCEMVGIGPGAYTSAVARVCILDWDGEIVLDTFVKVNEPVTDYRTFVSGIRKEDIESDSAMDREKCRALVQSIIRGKILIGHALHNDLDVLNITHPSHQIRDTATYGPFMARCDMMYFSPVRKGSCGSLTESECSSTTSSGSEHMNLRSRKLKDLALERLGMIIQTKGKEHSPVEDAYAALALYKLERIQWERVMMMGW
jgi:DNA polymerase III epsilon subunit-like protein